MTLCCADDCMNWRTGWQSSFLTILREHGRERFTHGTSFVVACGRQAEFESEDPDRPGQDVTDAWLKAERSGYIKIENHSWSHGRQIPDDLEAAMSEIARASDMIDAILGPGYCRLFAYPYGQHNEYLAREFFPNFKARHRMKAAFASEPRPVSINDDRWRLPRFVCGRDWCSADELRALLVDSSPQARVVVPKVAEWPIPDVAWVEISFRGDEGTAP